jgi:two-component response regulator (ARR-B family)
LFLHVNVVMSADDEKSVIVESLQRGAAFYMVKPVRPDDLKHVWQYAVPAKKGKSVVIEEIRSIPEESSGEKASYDDLNSASATSAAVNHEEHGGKKDPKRKALKKGNEIDRVGDHDNAAAPKKAKVVWTTSLHNRFLQAIRHIGLESNI